MRISSNLIMQHSIILFLIFANLLPHRIGHICGVRKFFGKVLF